MAQVSGIESKQESLRAEVEEASYNLEHATVVAPADGYLVNLMLCPGAFIRLMVAAPAGVVLAAP